MADSEIIAFNDVVFSGRDVIAIATELGIPGTEIRNAVKTIAAEGWHEWDLDTVATPDIKSLPDDLETIIITLQNAGNIDYATFRLREMIKKLKGDLDEPTA